MQKKSMMIAAIVVVAIVAIAAAAFAFGNNDNGGDDKTSPTYYFYLDGMDGNNGWHSAQGDSVKSAFISAMDKDGVKYTFSGSMVSFDGFESKSGTDASGNYTGTSFSIFEYISTNVGNYNADYFVAGPALENVVSNIVYISYGDYVVDKTTYVTEYKLSPTTTEAKLSESGPFTAEDYKPLAYGTYYFYLDGMDSNNGWYSASGSDISEAFKAAMDKAGIKYNLSASGWVTFDGYEGISTPTSDGGYVGKGVSIRHYVSSDVANYYAGYFVSGPVLTSSASGIVYISFGDYTMDSSWNTVYSVTPDKNTGLSSTGPFA